MLTDSSGDSARVLLHRRRLTNFLLSLLVSLHAGIVGAQDRLNGFDLSKPSVPRELIVQGGPPRDGIPALTDPTFIEGRESRYVRPTDRVIGIALDGVAKAYPLAILNWHEIVNDRLGQRAVTVTYCPLCFTGMAFDAMVDGKRQMFGVSGLLYNSDVLLYDIETESLWSQIMKQAISGPRRGQKLVSVPASNTTWADWRERHPDSLLLSHETGHARDYNKNSYAHYDQSPDVIFPVRFRAQGYHPKEYVLGVVIDGVAKAYPVSELSQAKQPIRDSIGKTTVLIRYNDEHVTAEANDENNLPLDGVMAYWFAWYAFHPDTLVFRAKRN